jgi:hypothetical protein
MATVGPAIVKELAKLEPESHWRIKHKSEGHWLEVVNDTGESISLYFDQWEGRVTACGNYAEMPDGQRWLASERMPYEWRKTKSDPRPTYSIERPAATIAKDLTKRLLPEYREIRAVNREQILSRCDFVSTGRNLTAELQDLGRGLLGPFRQSKEGSGDFSASFTQDTGGVSYGSLQVSGDHIRMEVSLSPAAIKKILAALAAP